MTPRARILLSLLSLAWLAPPALAGTPCSKADYTKIRRRFQALYDAGEYTKAVETLRPAKAACWEALDATARGWLVSDLGLAALRAGQPDLCLQTLADAPRELEPQSRVSKAIAHNRGLCTGASTSGTPAAPRGTPLLVQVMPGLQVSSPAEAAAALTREWRAPYALREGSSRRGGSASFAGVPTWTAST